MRHEFPKQRNWIIEYKLQTPETTLTGVIVAADWDESARVVTIMLATDAEEEYIISDTAPGRQLRDYLNHEARITGILSVDKNGTDKYLTVHSFKILT